MQKGASKKKGVSLVYVKNKLLRRTMTKHSPFFLSNTISMIPGYFHNVSLYVVKQKHEFFSTKNLLISEANFLF